MPGKRKVDDKLWCSHCGKNVQQRTYKYHGHLQFWDNKNNKWIKTENNMPLKPRFSPFELADSDSSDIDGAADERAHDSRWDHKDSAPDDISDSEHPDSDGYSSSSDGGDDYNHEEVNYAPGSDSDDGRSDDDGSGEYRQALGQDVEAIVKRLSVPVDEEDVSVNEQASANAMPNRQPVLTVNRQASAFAWLITAWVHRFAVPDTSLGTLMLILALFLPLSMAIPQKATIKNAVRALRSITNTTDGTATITERVMCPKCSALYDRDACWRMKNGKKVSTNCTSQPIPGHKQKKFRVCRERLMDTSTSGNLVPRSIMPYCSLKAQLEMMYSDPEYEKLCAEWKHRETEDGVMTDVYDGQVWQESSAFLEEDDGASNLGLCLNIDWFAPYKSSSASLGVVLLCNYNLPRRERYKRENVVLVAILPKMGSKKSTLMNNILKPFVTEMQELYTTGARIPTQSRPEGRLVKVKLLCVACDTPAARAVCGYPGVGSYMGCTRCNKRFRLIPSDDRSDGRRRMHTFDYGGFGQCEPRNDEDQRKYAREWLGQRSYSGRKNTCRTHGARWTVLMRLKYYDSVRFCVVDPMHCIFLCNARHIVTTWIESGRLDNVKLGERLSKIKLPPGCGRTFVNFTRAKVLGSLRAADWKLFVLVTSGAVLHGLLPDQDIAMWLEFRKAVMLMCCSRLTSGCVEEIGVRVEKYCRMFEHIYGSNKITPSQHFITHIVDCIRDYGPCHVFWLFAFERVNGMLTKASTNNKFVALTIMRHMVSYQASRRVVGNGLVVLDECQSAVWDVTTQDNSSGGGQNQLTSSMLAERLESSNTHSYTGAEPFPFEVRGLAQHRVVIDVHTHRAVLLFIARAYTGQYAVVHRVAIVVPKRINFFMDQLAVSSWNGGRSANVLVRIAGNIVPAVIKKILVMSAVIGNNAHAAAVEHRLLEVEEFQPYRPRADSSSSSSNGTNYNSTNSANLGLLAEISSRVWQAGTHTNKTRVIVPLLSVVCKFAPFLYSVEETRRKITQRGQRRRTGTVAKSVRVMRVCPIVLRDVST
jgi:hypothetical protein